MNSYQAQQFWNDINGIIGFTASIIMVTFVVGMVRNLSGATPKKRLWIIYYGVDAEGKTGWHAYEESTWSGARIFIDVVLKKKMAEEAYAIQAPTRYQAIKIAKERYSKRLPELPEYHSPTLQQFVDAELEKLVSRYRYTPYGISFEGREVLGDAIGGHLGGFIFLTEDFKDYWVYDKEKARVLVKYTIAHEYSHLMVLYEGVEKYLPEDIEEKGKEEYLEGIADGFATKWIGFTMDDIDKIIEALDKFCKFREQKSLL